MALSNTTKKVLVWSVALAVLGVGGYFGYKAWKKRRDEKRNDQQPVADGDGNLGGGSGSSGGASSNPFKSEAEIKAFQDWLDKNKPFWIKDTDGKYKNLRTGTASEPNRHIGGRGYGSYGENTAKAYALFGAEYTSRKGGIASQTNIPDNLKLILQRVGSRAVYKKIDRGLFGVEVLYEFGNRKLPFRFFDNNRFFVLNEQGYPLFKGSYSDGGRELSVSYDIWSRVSKNGNTYKSDSFWTTGQKLFTDKK